jgi:hypothetical protein
MDSLLLVNILLKTFYVRTGGVAHVVEYLPSKHEFLSSNSSTTTKTKQQNKLYGDT